MQAADLFICVKCAGILGAAEMLEDDREGDGILRFNIPVSRKGLIEPEPDRQALITIVDPDSVAQRLVAFQIAAG